MNRKTLIVRMPYIGKVLSVNHFKFQGRYTRPEAKRWMQQLTAYVRLENMAHGYHKDDWRLPIEVVCDGWFRDKRHSPDLSNLSKVVLDSIEKALGINDKNMRWVDGEVSYGLPAELTIKIREAI